MGDPRRLRKKYNTPSNMFERTRIVEELRYVGRYGLRNKQEFWKHKAQLSAIREQARKARASTEEVQQKRLNEMRSRLTGLGLVTKDARLDDMLGISIDQILNRRLQTIVLKKGLAKTIYQARQLITHGHISVGDAIVDSPSYLVPIADENQIGFAINSSFYQKNDKIWGDQSPVQVADLAAKEADKIKKDQKPSKEKDRRGKGRRRNDRGSRDRRDAAPADAPAPAAAESSQPKAKGEQ